MKEEFYPLSDPLAWKLLEEKYDDKPICLNTSDVSMMEELQKKWKGPDKNPFEGLIGFLKKHQAVVVKSNG